MGKRKGFTIIEVSLVLGLAGLIFVAVFTILPSLMASERDSERRDDMITLVNNLKNFQTNNNRGALPDNGATATVTWSTAANASNATSWAGFYKDFLGKDFTDPNGTNYVLNIQECSNAVKISDNCRSPDNHNNHRESLTEWLEKRTFDDNDYNVYILLSASCDGSTAIKSGNARKVAVLYRLERANGVYCTNS